MASAYTRTQLLADVRKIFPDDAQFTDEEIIRYANFGIRRIASTRGLELSEHERTSEALVVTAGVRTVDISSLNARAIISVKDITNDKRLRLITIDQSAEWDETDEGEPEAYLRFAETLRLYPMPSSDYGGDVLRIVYYARATEYTSSSSSTSSFPIELDEAILCFTLYRLYALNDEPERATNMFTQAMGVLRDFMETRALEYRYEDHGIGVIDLGHYGD